MFILTVKGQNLKLFFSVVSSILVILTVVLMVPVGKGGMGNGGEIAAGKEISKSDFKNIATNEDRIMFLKQYGWEVEAEPRNIEEIQIPTEFDPIFEKYNQMQISEGLDLEKYKGKSVKKYTYLVSNYEYDGTVFANLLIYKDTVIGGDIASANSEGFVHGLTPGSDFLT